jgi:hypothetical protein
MEKNVGKIDSIIRLILGVALIIIGFVYANGIIEILLIILGIILMVTSFAKFCALYKLLGINTLKK